MATQPSLIDRLIGAVSPAAALRRHINRQALTRAYEAASPRDPWRPRRSVASANADHSADAATLRAKARSLVQNVPYITRGVEGLVDYTIGGGIVSRATGKDAAAFNAALAKWSKVCDADGRLDWPGLQAAAYRAMEVDGEVLIRLRPRRPEDGLPIPLQLQLLEVDWLDNSRTGWIGGEEVVNGIVYDALGRVAAYYLHDRHPGDVFTSRNSRSQSQRIEARSIIHLFDPRRPGQGRGFSRLAPVIGRARDLQLYEDAELARKNLESRLGVLASGNLEEAEMPNTSGTASSAATFGDLGELPGGSIVRLPDGVNTTLIEPKPAAGYVDNVSFNLHLIAAGLGVPYDLMTGDLRQTNFSSGRIGRMNFKRSVEATQWRVLMPRLIEPVCIAAMQAARLAGVIRNFDPAFDHSCPKWEYVNPAQDVESDAAEIATGLTSLSEKLRQRGYSNPDDVYNELKSDFDKLQASGVLPILMALQGNKAAAAAITAPAPAASPGKARHAADE